MSFAAQMGTADNIINLFREYSVEADDGDLSNTHGTVIANYQQVNEEGDAVDLKRHKIRGANAGLCYVELKKSKSRDKAQLSRQQIRDALEQELGRGLNGVNDFAELGRRQRAGVIDSARGIHTLKTVIHSAPTGAAVPCWFLPWVPAGGVADIKIPPSAGGAATNQDPVFFLTAALSGCSVFVRGADTAPHVFHCGTSKRIAGGSSAADIWQGIIQQLGYQDNTTGAIHSRDYTVPTRETGRNLRKATEREKRDVKRLQRDADQHGDLVKIESVQTWGSVFGVRSGTHWRFFLQENCSVTYHTIRRSSILKRRIDIEGTQRTYSRPVICRQIFPTGGGRAEFRMAHRTFK